MKKLLNESEKSSQLIRMKEASAFVEKIPDRDHRHFLRFALARVIGPTELTSDASPAEPFDLEFFVSVISAMYKSKAYMLDILNGKGDDLLIWPEEM
jgi:hypothetical protein